MVRVGNKNTKGEAMKNIYWIKGKKYKLTYKQALDKAEKMNSGLCYDSGPRIIALSAGTVKRWNS